MRIRIDYKQHPDLSEEQGILDVEDEYGCKNWLDPKILVGKKIISVAEISQGIILEVSDD